MLHPLRDPSAAVDLTAGAGLAFGPADWTSDFTPTAVRLLDLNAANDRATWRTLIRWPAAGDGKPAYEEEQQFDVYAIGAKDLYRIDVAWTLRATAAPLAFNAQTDGLSLALDARVTKQNTVATLATDLSAPFGDRTFGVALLAHPSNPASPASWRIVPADGATTALPWASIARFTIPPGKEQTFHYRLVIHAGELSPEKLQSELNQFGAVPFDPPPK